MAWGGVGVKGGKRWISQVILVLGTEIRIGWHAMGLVLVWGTEMV